MIKIGITGGIGSGKSTVAKLLNVLNYPVYSSDSRAKVLLHEKKEIHKAIREAFGDEVFDDADNPSRALLADLVFKNEDLLKKLNAIIHPAVRNDFNEWIKNQNSALIFKEAAIIFEHGLEKELDAVWVIDAPVQVRVNRVMKRSGLSEQQVHHRMNNQLNAEQLRQKANLIINNDDEHALIPQVIHALNSLL